MRISIDLGLLAIAAVAIWFLLGKPIDKGDQVQFYTDPGTACEYLISPNGTLVPRIDHDYMQGGCDPQEDY